MKCKYWDCGFCYAPNDVVTSASSSSSCIYPEHCPYLKTEMTNQQPEVMSSGTAIISDENGVPTKVHLSDKEKLTEMTEKEQIQNQIQELQEKLKKLEEQEPEMLLLRQGKVDFVGYKKKAYLRIEYTDSLSGVYKWYKREITFGDGLRFTLILDHSQFYYLLEELYQKEVVKQKEEVSSTKSPTLYDICVDWKNADINPPVSDLIDDVEKWLPKPQSANSQNAYVESAVEGFNDCLQQIKSKLR